MLTLSVVIGFYVIGKVAHSLHTPLMSITNAISGIIIVGAMSQIVVPSPLVQGLAYPGFDLSRGATTEDIIRVCACGALNAKPKDSV